MLPQPDEPLTFETLSTLLDINRFDVPWTYEMTMSLIEHRDAGVELHPLHRRDDVHCDQGLPLHNLLWRAMADNLDGAWPEVVRWMSYEQALDGRQQEHLVNMWRGFWVDMDPLDTKSMIEKGGDGSRVALESFEQSLRLLEDVGVPHPQDVTLDDWNDVLSKTLVGRLVNVQREKEVLRTTMDALPANTAVHFNEPKTRARL